MAEAEAVPVVRDIRKEIVLILEGVITQLMTIPFPPETPRQDTPEFIQMHYCDRCRGYHRVKES